MRVCVFVHAVSRCVRACVYMLPNLQEQARRDIQVIQRHHVTCLYRSSTGTTDLQALARVLEDALLSMRRRLQEVLAAAALPLLHRPRDFEYVVPAAGAPTHIHTEVDAID